MNTNQVLTHCQHWLAHAKLFDVVLTQINIRQSSNVPTPPPPTAHACRFWIVVMEKNRAREVGTACPVLWGVHPLLLRRAPIARSVRQIPLVTYHWLSTADVAQNSVIFATHLSIGAPHVQNLAVLNLANESDVHVCGTLRLNCPLTALLSAPVLFTVCGATATNDHGFASFLTLLFFSGSFTDYLGMVIGLLATFILLLFVVIVFIVVRHRRRRLNNNHKVDSLYFCKKRSQGRIQGWVVEGDSRGIHLCLDAKSACVLGGWGRGEYVIRGA